MRNNNKKAIRHISSKSLQNSKMRNLFAISAIALTCMMFTVLTSMGIGMVQVAQEQTMREVGTKSHAGLKNVTTQQMEKIIQDGRIKDYSWNILIGHADNLLKRSGEIRYVQGEEELENSFITLEEGSLPQREDEVVVDTIVMEELRVPNRVGEEITLAFEFLGEKTEKAFTVSGWYKGDQISHASMICVSKEYWDGLKGTRTDADFQEWGQKHPNDASIGLYNVNLDFANARDIEGRITAIIQDAGYEPDKEIGYGVNWAYMGSRMEDIGMESVILLGAGLFVILLTGYLIIYNIFQISIAQDIRFYGLLKTVGTTKRQLRTLIKRQALILSAVGIPLGLGIGFFIGKVLFPFSMSFINNHGMEIQLHFHPAILVFGTVFSLATVLISCRKPAKIAGNVSPIEAVRYSEGTAGRKKEKHSEKGAKVHRMALSNLGRNKKKTVLVVFSLSLSIVLLCVVLTGTSCFRIDRYLQSRLIGDVVIGSVSYTAGNSQGREFDQGMVAFLDTQEGVTGRMELWNNDYAAYLELDSSGQMRYAGFPKEALDKFSEFGGSLQEFDQPHVSADIYGYSKGLLQNLHVTKGTLDIERFQKGRYALLADYNREPGCALYEPGEKITIHRVTKNSEGIEVKDENGETIDVIYKDLDEQEYEVMALVQIPSGMDRHSYLPNAVQLVLPEPCLLNEDDVDGCFAMSYTVEKEHLDAFIQAAKDYTENENHLMGYLTKEALEKEFSGMIHVIWTIGVALSLVIGLIGILNFTNSIFTGIITRKKEFAMLCSIGMTKQQLKRMLLEESLYYVLICGAISIPFGSLAAYGILRSLNQVILFFEYRYNFLAFVFMLPLMALVALVLPQAAYHRMQKESIVERLRDS